MPMKWQKAQVASATCDRCGKFDPVIFVSTDEIPSKTVFVGKWTIDPYSQLVLCEKCKDE